MTQYFEYLPDGDIENDGWTLVASSATTVWEILGYYEDDCHVRCPSYRGGLEVRFPFDDDRLPVGAVVDSVTVFVKMQTSSGSGARGVTVNVLSSSNRSRYTTRTVYATSSLDTYEVGTYTKDPLGRAWDIDRLNRLRLRMFTHNDLADSIRIYGLWCRVNFHTKGSVTVTSPTGTVNTPSPTISWTYTQEEGEPQKAAQYKIFTLNQSSASTFNPDTDPPVFAADTTGIANSYVLPTSLNGDDYAVYVRAQSQFGAWTSWASKQFTVSAPSPGVPGDNNAGVAGIPGVGVPTVIPDNYTSSAAIRMTDSSNLLSVQQADFEIASDPLGYVGSNCTLTRDTTRAYGGGLASMKMVATANGDMEAVTTRLEIQERMPVTVTAQFYAAGLWARNVEARARFLDETFTPLDPSTDIVAAGTDASSTWTKVEQSGTTPAGAKYVEISCKVVGAFAPPNSDAHHVDHVGLMYGTNTQWSDGGHASRNLLTSFLATGDDPASLTDSWVQANTATTTTRAATSGTGAHGLKCNRMSYVGVSPSIAYRAKSTSWTSNTTGKDFTLNKPTGIQDNDLLIAFVTSTEHGSITPPVGWTVANTASVDDGSTDIALYVLKRTALASDPTSWATGTLSVNSSRRTAVVVAYSGAAHADQQFIADAVRTDSTGALVHRTAEVVNTDPNAWRVAAFAASDNVTGGSFIANKNAPNTSALTISYVGKSSSWLSQTSNTSFTINKPTGVQQGDLMIAAALFSGSTGTVNTPTGWTLVRKTVKEVSAGTDDHSGSVTMVVFKRVATASEPNSWSATHTTYGQPKITQTVAYRGCDSALIAETADTALNRSSVSTGSVTNTDSKAWRVEFFGATSSFENYWQRADNVERCDESSSLSNHPDTVISVNDSNGMIGTGSHSRTANLGDGSFFAAIGWIGILKPASSVSLPGANETERFDVATGASNPWETTAVYDSNGIVGTGATSVYGQMTSSDGEANAMASWVGLIRPASSVQGGTAAAYPNKLVDIGAIDSDIATLAGGKVTVMADFKGSASGTPTLSVQFYRANQLIGTQSTLGRAFGTDGFTKSWAVFSIPAGTTRMRPVLSALEREVGDTVDFDRVAVMLGALADPSQEPQWRNGTARPEHPVWSHPVIQFQENDGTGYGDWQTLPGQKALPPTYDLNTGEMFYVDHTIVPLNSRRYRVATLSHGLNGDLFSSGFGPASQEAVFEPRAWWLKDIQDLSKNIEVTVRWKDMQVDTANMATTFQPIGANYPVVVTEGFKGDTFALEIHCEQSEFTALMQLLNSGRTLILQSDIDKMWWVRPVGNISSNILATGSRRERPRRYVSVTFVQVAPEE